MGCRWAALIKRGISQIAMSAVITMVMSPAPARDLEGRYRNSPLHEWFESLASGKGLCCSFADGHAVEDVDWETRDGHYRVRLPKTADSKLMVWVDVPDDAVITVPNKAGRTMVWPVYDELFLDISIRCFMPGSMT
ncbi:hypothetical protein M2191_000015 [Bradyrhizobium japonicum]|nr:hypothetical protein [Bradyrhizobium japonicum]